jgi:hypothetical protein
MEMHQNIHTRLFIPIGDEASLGHVSEEAVNILINE